MADRSESRARRLWRAVEPVHAVTYFAARVAAGVHRAGHPRLLDELLRAAGRPAGPGARRGGHRAVLQLPSRPGAAGRCPTSGRWPPRSATSPSASRPSTPRCTGCSGRTCSDRRRWRRRPRSPARPRWPRRPPVVPLAAANAALSWPDPPHLVLWHAQTVLREHRGDGHVAALLTAGLDPVEALVLFAADQDLDADWLRTRRGWSETGVGAARWTGWPPAGWSSPTGASGGCRRLGADRGRARRAGRGRAAHRRARRRALGRGRRRGRTGWSSWSPRWSPPSWPGTASCRSTRWGCGRWCRPPERRGRRRARGRSR